MPLAADQFAEAVVAAGLSSAGDMQAFWNSLPADTRPNDGETLAARLIELGKLTPFQAQELLSGTGTPLVLGDYVLLAKIGAGGMGQVFKAQHRHMKRLVAIKLLPSALTKDDAAVKRFQREVEAAAKLAHPNIVQAYDASVQRGVWYLVMEYVEGRDLSHIVATEGPLPIPRVLDYLRQAARGLGFAHDSGVVHRDIKPANLLLDKKGTIKILDMGLARFDDGLAAEDGLTQSGQVMGTVDYMAPEQAFDTHTADARADIYSLGCTLYRLLTGKNLYDGETLVQKLMKHQSAPIPSLLVLVGQAASLPSQRVGGRESGVGGNSDPASGGRQPTAEVLSPLDAVFQKMVAKRPDDRYATMAEVEAALAALTVSLPTSVSSASGRREPAEGTSGPARQSHPSATGITLGPVAAAGDLSPTVSLAGPQHATDPVSDRSIEIARSKSSVPTVVKPHPRWRSPLVLAAGSLAGALLVAFGIWTWLRGGDDVARIKVPRNGSATLANTSLPPGESGRRPGESEKNLSYARPNVELNEWSEPMNLGPVVNTSSHEWSPCISADGLTLLWSSDRLGGNQADLWMSTRSSEHDPWDKPVNLGETVNSQDADTGPSLSVDGLALFFASTRPGGLGQSDIWMCLRDSIKGSFSAAFRLPGGVNSNTGDVHPFLSADGHTLLLQSGRERGEDNIWQCKRAKLDEPFDTAQLLESPINGPSTEAEPALTVDGLRLFFMSERPGGVGGRDLWMCVRGSLKDPFGSPVNLGPKVNSTDRDNGPSLSADGNTLYFYSDRAGGQGGHDLWMCTRKSFSTGLAETVPPLAKAPFPSAEARRHQQTWADYLGMKIETPNSVGTTMVLIPPGEFLMGSSDEQIEVALKMAEEDWARLTKELIQKYEQPQHRVLISNPFQMGATEVTVGQFKKFATAMNYQTEAEKAQIAAKTTATPSPAPDQPLPAVPKPNQTYLSPGYAITDDSPVAWITWNEMVAYCNWLSDQEKATYRLPTEAEWEFACRAGTTTQFSCGNDVNLLKKYAWFEGNRRETSHAAGILLPNAFGLFDMHGSLNERCQKLADGQWDSSSNNSSRPPSAFEAVIRGGQWLDDAYACRSAYRATYALHLVRNDNIGFRVVRELNPPKNTAKLPASAAAGGGNVNDLDLLAAVDPSALTSKMQWRQEGGHLIGTGAESDKADWATFVFPSKFSGSYDLTIEFTQRGGFPLQFTLPLGDRAVCASVAPDGGSIFLIDDDNDPPETSKNKAIRLRGDFLHRFTAEVRHQGPEVTIKTALDGVRVGEFSGLRSRLSVPHWVKPDVEQVKVGMHGSLSHLYLDFSRVTVKIVPDVSPTSAATPPPAKAPFDTAGALAHQGTWAKHLAIREENVNSVGMKLALIPPGQFLMGRRDDEGAKLPRNGLYVEPAATRHQVTLTRPYLIGTTEVTQRQWREVVGSEPWNGQERGEIGDDYPATYTTKDGAVDFCRRLSEKEGLTYRLPTEAEWEFACRAGTETISFFGDNQSLLGEYAVKGTMQPVAAKKPNPWGLFDMYGNLWEWVADGPAPHPAEATVDPLVAPADRMSVIRGSCFRSAIPNEFSSGARHTWPGSLATDEKGFRVVCEVNEAARAAWKIKAGETPAPQEPGGL